MTTLSTNTLDLAMEKTAPVLEAGDDSACFVRCFIQTFDDGIMCRVSIAFLGMSGLILPEIAQQQLGKGKFL